jgi:tetratricopeptide (TPR) repeat protein
LELNSPGILRNHIAFFIALFWVSLAYAQEHPQPIIRFSHPGLDKINTLVASRQYEEAINSSLAQALEMKKDAHWEGYIAFMLRAADVETFEVWKAKGFPEINIREDYRRPLRYLDSLYKVGGKYIDNYPYLKADAMFTQAVVYDLLNMPDTAEQLHLHALQQRIELYGNGSREVADSYLWMGNLYNWGLQRKNLAEQNYQKALTLQKKYLPDSRYALGSVYYGLATIARKNYQFDIVETMTNQYLSLYNDLPYEQAFAYQLIANMYSNQGNFQKSLQLRQRSIAIYEASGFREDLINGYSNLSSDLRGLGRFKESRDALASGLSIWKGSKVKDPFYAKMLYENFGDLYRLMEKYDSAQHYVDKALLITNSIYGGKSDEVADVYDLRGHLFMDRNDFGRALDDFQQMLVSVIPGFAPADSLKIPGIQDESPYFLSIIAAHFNKGDAFAEWYQHDKKPVYLEHALENYRMAYNQMMIARQTIGDELSKPFLLSSFQKSIERSIQCANILYKLRKDKKNFEDILHFVEFTKYLNVLEALRRAERANNSGIPKSLLFELDQVRSDLNSLQRTKLTSSEIPVDSASRINDEMINLINRRRELMSQISGYPGYSLSSLDSIFTTLDGIQSRLTQDEQVLEFFWGADRIYTLSITDESTGVLSLNRDPEVDSLIFSVYHFVSGVPRFGQAQVNIYSACSSQVYKKLFEPLIEKKKLTIIPDGPLSLIPAEALVVSHQQAKSSYKTLHYLIYDREISYAYSSSILFKNMVKNAKSIEGVLAFSYSGSTGNNQIARGNGASELPGTFLELETLSRLFGDVTRFTDNDASKFNFIHNASGHNLIHLGVHGVGDQETADNSRLIFKGDSLSDTDLYAYEIYNLKLDASLVVLSACETGIGRNQTGEGMFSIARAFTYAGCPSVVMSLWKVRDIFTSDIMIEFYENLKQGLSVSASLRHAKLQFLKDAEEFSAHPANWAAFVVNGQDLTFQSNSKPHQGIYILSGALLFLFLLGILSYRKKFRTRLP